MNALPNRSETIASLNDAFRARFGTFPEPPEQDSPRGHIVFTSGIAGLGIPKATEICHKVVRFKEFSADNDPYGERDFGAIEDPDAGTVFWKIDCYDYSLERGSEDPADPSITHRVLTIMLAREY